MIVLGWILLVTGLVALAAGEVLVLAMAYRLGFGWLLACLLLEPLAWLALLILHFREARRPVGVAFAGLLLAGIGGMMLGD